MNPANMEANEGGSAGMRPLRHIRSALYVPASNTRALGKARGLDADMLFVDLEDAVPADMKDDARKAAAVFLADRPRDKPVALRINAPDSMFFDADMAAAIAMAPDYVIVPKVQSVDDVDRVAMKCTFPVMAMIETPAGLYAAREIAAHDRVAALIAGTNDIAAECGIRPGPERQGLELSLQMIVLAAAAGAIPAFDGVNNALDDMTGFAAECAQGYAFGFSAKTLIHPNQIAIANDAFMANEAELEEAKALLVEAKAGAERFRGRMIENMHVENARFLLERAGQPVNLDN